MSEQSLLGRVVFINGAEPFLASRTIDSLVGELRAQHPDVNVNTVEASDITDAGHLAELTGGSLFAEVTATVLWSVASTNPDIHPALLELVAHPIADLGLIVVHTGGQAGRALVDKLRKGSSEVIDCSPIKTWELPRFVVAEGRRNGAKIDPETATLIVDSVGSDLRSLSAAVAQLLVDTDDGHIRENTVRRYFAGRAEVTSFSVADAVMAGNTVAALERLRWALSTGVAPVLVSSALAGSLRSLGKYFGARGGGRDVDIARQIGVPVWKVKDIAQQSRHWTPAGVAASLQAVASADAAIKGAQSDPAYALEHLVMTAITHRSA